MSHRWAFKQDLRYGPDDSRGWELYPAEDSERIEKAFLEKKTKVKLNATYSIDFGEKIQYRNDDRDKRRFVQRQAVEEKTVKVHVKKKKEESEEEEEEEKPKKTKKKKDEEEDEEEEETKSKKSSLKKRGIESDGEDSPSSKSAKKKIFGVVSLSSTDSLSSLKLSFASFLIDDGTGKDYFSRFGKLGSSSSKARAKLLEDIKDQENHWRTLFARPKHSPSALDNPELGLLDVFKNSSMFVYQPEEKTIPCVFALGDTRKPVGGRAIVADLTEFQTNFRMFSEGALEALDWSNVFLAGGSVQACLMPVPKESQRTADPTAFRRYFHDEAFPTSDIDIFIYGLDEAKGIEKMKKIYEQIAERTPYKVICFRSAYAVTLVSRYPYRHIQIVLRLYKSPAEILMGFDVDACSVGYDGKKVWCSPRAHWALTHQLNTVDMSRRSPSYEMRLAKYAQRGFEVQVPGLDRTKVDPTIMERPFDKVQGLSKLLLLEKLRTPEARFRYKKLKDLLGKIPNEFTSGFRDKLAILDAGNASEYSTVFLPWGPLWQAERIRKLMYKKDFVLNCGFIQGVPKKPYHRHPCFFGTMAQVISDCCTKCPVVPEGTPKEDTERFVAGDIKWVVDDPGRQQIGSFHPITEGDWTAGAYLEESSCQLVNAANNNSAKETKRLLVEEKADPNSHDALGRCPIHMCAITNAANAAKVLMDKGATITTRLVDGRTPTHLASMYGSLDVMKALLEKNEQLKVQKKLEEEKKKKGGKAAKKLVPKKMKDDDEEGGEGDGEEEEKWEVVGEGKGGEEEEDEEGGDDDEGGGDDDEGGDDDDEGGDDDDDDGEGRKKKKKKDEVEEEKETKTINIDAIDFNNRMTSLHYAILFGHVEIAELLLKNGASVNMKCTKKYNDSTSSLVDCLGLAALLGIHNAAQGEAMIRLLLKSGVKPASSTNLSTGLHKMARLGCAVGLKVFLEDEACLKQLNQMDMNGETALRLAVAGGYVECVEVLLSHKAELQTSPEQLDQLRLLAQRSKKSAVPEKTTPILYELLANKPANFKPDTFKRMVSLLLKQGADANTLVDDEGGGGFKGRRRKKAAKKEDKKKVSFLDKFIALMYDTNPEGRLTIQAWLDLMAQNQKLAPDSYPKFITDIFLFQKRKFNQAASELMDQHTFKDLLAFLKAQGFKQSPDSIEDLKPDDEEDKKEEKKAAKEEPEDEDFDSDNWQGRSSPLDFFYVVDDLRSYRRTRVPKVMIARYQKLFAAVWSGDLDTITNLCLKGDKKELTLICTKDVLGHTPLSIAVYRQQPAVVRHILATVKAQFTPLPTKDKPPPEEGAATGEAPPPTKLNNFDIMAMDLRAEAASSDDDEQEIDLDSLANVISPIEPIALFSQSANCLAAQLLPDAWRKLKKPEKDEEKRRPAYRRRGAEYFEDNCPADLSLDPKIEEEGDVITRTEVVYGLPDVSEWRKAHQADYVLDLLPLQLAGVIGKVGVITELLTAVPFLFNKKTKEKKKGPRVGLEGPSDDPGDRVRNTVLLNHSSAMLFAVALDHADAVAAFLEQSACLDIKPKPAKKQITGGDKAEEGEGEGKEEKKAEKPSEDYSGLKIGVEDWMKKRLEAEVSGHTTDPSKDWVPAKNPLHVAGFYGALSCLNFLSTKGNLEKSLGVYVKKFPTSRFAKAFSSEVALRAYVLRYFSVRSVDEIGSSLLHYIAMGGEGEALEKMKSGLAIDRENKYDETPLATVCKMTDKLGPQHAEVVKQLVAAGADWTRGERGSTIAVGEKDKSPNPCPLLWSATRGHREVMLALLDGDDEHLRKALRTTNPAGQNVLHLSLVQKDLETAQAIWKRIKGGKKTGREELIKEILSTRDGLGNSLLHLAIVSRSLQILNFVIEILGPLAEELAMQENGHGLTAEDLAKGLLEGGATAMELKSGWNPHQGYERSIIEFYRVALTRLSKFEGPKRALADVAAAVRAMETAVGSANTGGDWHYGALMRLFVQDDDFKKKAKEKLMARAELSAPYGFKWKLRNL